MNAVQVWPLVMAAYGSIPVHMNSFYIGLRCDCHPSAWNGYKAKIGRMGLAIPNLFSGEEQTLQPNPSSNIKGNILSESCLFPRCVCAIPNVKILKQTVLFLNALFRNSRELSSY